MRLPSRWRGRAGVLAVPALAVLLASCDRESVPRAPPVDAALWKVGVWKPPPRPFPRFRVELAAIDLPWAGDPGSGERRRPPWTQLTVNLEIDETRGPGIYFLGNSWPLDAESRQRALDSLRRDLPLLRRDEILLRAAYRLPWADLRDVLRVLGDPALRIGRVAFAVASSDPSEWREARIDADPLVGPASPAAPLVLVWSMADGPVLDIGGGATVMAFPAGEPYTAPVVGPSNLLWRRLLGALGEARAGATTSVVLRIDPRVPWAHVAQTLGLVVARGPADVSIEGGLRWRMSTPTRSPDRLGGPGRELVDLHPAVAVGIGVGLALAAVGLVAAGSRRRPRRPPST